MVVVVAIWIVYVFDGIIFYLPNRDEERFWRRLGLGVAVIVFPILRSRAEGIHHHGAHRGHQAVRRPEQREEDREIEGTALGARGGYRGDQTGDRRARAAGQGTSRKGADRLINGVTDSGLPSRVKPGARSTSQVYSASPDQPLRMISPFKADSARPKNSVRDLLPSQYLWSVLFLCPRGF
jgi:hypothetical protein